MASDELFSVPIPTLGDHPGGQIICSTPAPQVYLLTFTSPVDNRLTPAFCNAMITALDVIEYGHAPGVVVTTSGIAKFYSNGLDLGSAMADPSFWENSLYPMYRRLITYSMPTVALINGHAFAGGIMLAMHHDYRVFTDKRGFLCVNELEFGAPLPPPLAGIFRTKCSPLVYRSLVLEAKRYDAKSALDAGLVDAVGELGAALEFINERALVKKGTKGSYGLLKAEMYRENIALLDVKGKLAAGDLSLTKKEKKRRAEGSKWVAEWKASQDPKSKL